MNEFKKRTTTPEKNNEHYFSSTNFFAKYGYGMPNCTAYAWGRWHELYGISVGCRGNAGGWIDEVKKNTKFEVSDKPVLGAIAVWKKKGTKNEGHVGVVEEIKSNGNIVTSNSAYNGKMFYTSTIKAKDNYNKDDATEFMGFIIPPVNEEEGISGEYKVLGSLNLRDKAGTDGKILRVMHKGDVFTAIGEYESDSGNIWLLGYIVTYSAKDDKRVPICGYASKRYLEKILTK